MALATWRLVAIGAVLAGAVGLFVSCGADDDKDDDNDETTTALTFAKDVNPILKKSCAGAECHSSSSDYTHYIDGETVFVQKKADVKSRIESTVAGLQMPPAGNAEGMVLSAADKATLLSFIAQ